MKIRFKYMHNYDILRSQIELKTMMHHGEGSAVDLTVHSGTSACWIGKTTAGDVSGSPSRIGRWVGEVEQGPRKYPL
jgi:hypothetical protein